MKKKKITAIMAVIMMAAGLSACSQSNAKLEGKSGIVKDEASKTEGDTGVVDQAPATYVQDAEYIYYCIEGIDSKTNDKVQKYFKLEL